MNCRVCKALWSDDEMSKLVLHAPPGGFQDEEIFICPECRSTVFEWMFNNEPLSKGNKGK